MSWTDILGHEAAKRLLQAHLASGQVASAYLLVGPEGIGKRRLAHEMATALNCASPAAPCGACPVCAQIAKGIHPDVHTLAPAGASEQIRIDPVRHVLGRIALRPFSARFQVVIVDGADRLTEEAANALLKSLEEPPAHSRFLLVASQLFGCLPTIVSRCQILRCRRLTPVQIEELLTAQQTCEPAMAATIAHRCGGSLARAREQIERVQQQRRWQEQFLRTDAAGWLAAPLPESRQEAAELLDGMVLWLRDVACTRYGVGTVAQGVEAALERQARQVDPDRCLDTVWELMALRQSLEQFVSPRLIGALAREKWLSLVGK